MCSRASRSSLFPYATLFRSVDLLARAGGGEQRAAEQRVARQRLQLPADLEELLGLFAAVLGEEAEQLFKIGWELQDRKSTRLNSSHVEISYAVFCLKKKKKT